MYWKCLMGKEFSAEKKLRKDIKKVVQEPVLFYKEKLSLQPEKDLW